MRKCVLLTDEHNNEKTLKHLNLVGVYLQVKIERSTYPGNEG